MRSPLPCGAHRARYGYLLVEQMPYRSVSGGGRPPPSVSIIMRLNLPHLAVIGHGERHRYRAMGWRRGLGSALPTKMQPLGLRLSSHSSELDARGWFWKNFQDRGRVC